MARQWTPTVHHYKDMAGNRLLAYEVETKCVECQRLSRICARVQDRIEGACYSCKAQRKHCSLAIHRTTKFVLGLDTNSQSHSEPMIAPQVRTTKFELRLDEDSQEPIESKNLGGVGILTKFSPKSKVLSDAIKVLRTDQSKTNRFKVVSARPYPSIVNSSSPVGPSGVKRTPFNVVRTLIKKQHKVETLRPKVQIKKEREPNVQRTVKKQCNISRWTSQRPISLIEAEDGNFTLQT